MANFVASNDVYSRPAQKLDRLSHALHRRHHHVLVLVDRTVVVIDELSAVRTSKGYGSRHYYGFRRDEVLFPLAQTSPAGVPEDAVYAEPE